MTPDLWQSLKPLFEQAIDLPAEERAAFVSEACRGNESLRRELTGLLRAHEETADTLDRPLVLPGLQSDSVNWLPAGHVIMGRFEIVRHLGSGGMGDVYEALDRDLGVGPGRIALKTVRCSIASDPAALARFKSEVVLARRVGGPHVCRIYELYVPNDAKAAGCRAFLTMEYLEGTTLADCLETLRHGANAALAIAEASAIAAQLCKALQSIHEAGVIHRDLKPRNIMLTKHNGHEKVVVMDFGLARERIRAVADAETGLTLPGTVMGTPDYMAPEQLEGKEASAATDIYALGLILYEMVTGRQPYASSTPLGAAVRRAHRPERASSLRRGLPTAWDDVIECCTLYEPEERFQSAREVMDELRKRRLVVWRFEQGQRIALTPRGSIFAASSLLLLLAGMGWHWYATRPPKQPPEMARRWYEKGKAALRRGSYLEATYALGQATVIDNTYAMAHAGLAEAWSELDSTGRAEQEMLIASAPEQMKSLQDSDRRYIEAVRRTLVRDYSAAAQNYEAILKEVPESAIEQREAAYVDLGRAYEKAGKVPETIEKYEQAAKMMPDDPAPFLRLGVLKSRKGDFAGGETDFRKAEAIYKDSGSREGLAEVAYQRGYAANVVAESERSKFYLDESLSIAKEMGSAQLEARSHSQLSSLADGDGHEDLAIEEANQAIEIAQENGLEYWSTDGLMRLGNAYLGKEDFATAIRYLNQALEQAKRNQHPRIEAVAERSLANMANQQHKWDDVIRYAKAALPYFHDFDFAGQEADCATMLVRAERSKGDLAAALKDANGQVMLAQAHTDNKLAQSQAEEALGSVLLLMEEYPSALEHMDDAIKLSHELKLDSSYEELSAADALEHLGRFTEAEARLRTIPAEEKKRRDKGAGAAAIEARMQLYRGDAEAATTARMALARFGGLNGDRRAELLDVEAIAEARFGQIALSRRNAEQALIAAQEGGEGKSIAEAQLTLAQAQLRAKAPKESIAASSAAGQYFEKKNERESMWISFYVEAEARRVSGDIAGAALAAKKALDILVDIENSWGAPNSTFYSNRPDIKLAQHDLSALYAA